MADEPRIRVTTSPDVLPGEVWAVRPLSGTQALRQGVLPNGNVLVALLERGEVVGKIVNTGGRNG